MIALVSSRYLQIINALHVVVQVMVVRGNRAAAVNGKLAFSTRLLEPEPGDMLVDAAKVYASAAEHPELAAARYAKQLAKDKAKYAREVKAKAAVAAMHFQVVEGTVAKVARARKDQDMEYGVLVDVEHDDVSVRGLLHASEVSHDEVDRMSNVFQVGDTVKVRSSCSQQACALASLRTIPRACMHAVWQMCV